MDFDEKFPDCITAMNSDLGEHVPFEKSVQCAGGVEFWLNTLLQTVRDTVKNVVANMAQCLVDPEYDFIAGFVHFCGQVTKFIRSKILFFFVNPHGCQWWCFIMSELPSYLIG